MNEQFDLFEEPSSKNHPKNNFPFNEETGKQLKDDGMRRAVEHADAVNENWSINAYNFLMEYMKTHHEFFCEDVMLASFGVIPKPPDPRAWGSIITKARKSGKIISLGFKSVKIKTNHCAPRNFWRVAN